MKKIAILFLMAVVICSFVNATPFVNTAKATGITITNDNGVITWTGKYGGQQKPQGPLAGKTIGLVVGCEFSDWQAYYLASFLPEFGATTQFIMDNNHLWKETRPSRESPIPHGQWGLSLTAGMDGLGLNGGKLKYPVVMVKSDDPKLKVANPKDYDAIIILGGHGGDIMVADEVATKWIKAVADRGVPVAGIGAGIMPMIHLGMMNGKKCVGNSSVDYMLKAVGKWSSAGTAVDGKILTAKDTYDTPWLVRDLCKQFDKSFKDPRENILEGKKVLMMVTDDWEDIEFCAPTMEFLYRGATYSVGLFDTQIRSKPVVPPSDWRQGSYGTSVPFQEIPDNYYHIVKQGNIPMSSFDIVWIPGAFNPWQIAALHTGFLKEAYANGKLVSAICHGPIALAAAGLLKDKKSAGWLACYDSIQLMGGTHVTDAAAIIDGRIITGQTPPQVPEYMDAMTEALLAYNPPPL
jgi:putative intracellular protease/amidase